MLHGKLGTRLKRIPSCPLASRTSPRCLAVMVGQRLLAHDALSARNRPHSSTPPSHSQCRDSTGQHFEGAFCASYDRNLVQTSIEGSMAPQRQPSSFGGMADSTWRSVSLIVESAASKLWTEEMRRRSKHQKRTRVRARKSQGCERAEGLRGVKSASAVPWACNLSFF
jgi:hypothetical protein